MIILALPVSPDEDPLFLQYVRCLTAPARPVLTRRAQFQCDAEPEGAGGTRPRCRAAVAVGPVYTARRPSAGDCDPHLLRAGIRCSGTVRRCARRTAWPRGKRGGTSIADPMRALRGSAGTRCGPTSGRRRRDRDAPPSTTMNTAVRRLCVEPRGLWRTAHATARRTGVDEARQVQAVADPTRDR